jgi:hypothetical protein
MVTALTRRTPARTLVVLLGPALVAVGGCAGGEDVTPESLRAARARWEKAGVRDYELEWASSGLSNSRYVVRVSDGQVRSIESVAPDGRRGVVEPPEPKFYGVEGLFLVIADELTQLDRAEPFGRPKGTKAVLRFTPDPDYGYPRRYRRDVLGAPMALAIDVLRFTPASPRAGPTANPSGPSDGT